ncbi:spermidine hydroxycinnamoyl transferase-like [Quillaja saponaria]|uniref:Spermidine hydroxycinnamoyl transferase-like n=1 Tax=Quillaja saponaria TaxID=32244 RepID=A0AAD7PZB4_QUISA|nr:spermidine hydroxycinnamoyl transferase-like [Quillaja saponaria]
MVTLTASYTVIPQEPTPNNHLILSEIDQIQPLEHATSIYVHKPNPNINSITTTIRAFRDSLSKILVYYYPLAGRLREITKGGLFELDCNAKGVTLIEAESGKKMVEYGDFAPTESIKELIPKLDYGNTPIEEWPLLLVQLTRFSCGGLCLGIAISHVLVDGWAAIQFINSWAKLAQGADHLDKHEIPLHDRTVFFRTSNPDQPRYRHREFQTPPLLLASSDTQLEDNKKKTSVALLEVLKDQVENLKKKANEVLEPTLAGNDRPYTRYEAIAAHIWRCVCKAREGDNNPCQPTVVRIMTDIRKRLKPSIPLNYSGNAIHVTLTPVCHYSDILLNPLSYAARVIREGTDMMTDEYIKSALDFTARKQHGDESRPENVEANFYGDPNISIGSWMSLPVYEADFGWGKPVYMGIGAMSGDGWSVIMSSPSGDGSVIVALCLQTPHLEAFKKIFYKDM